MAIEVTEEQVSSFLKQLIELGDIDVVDDSPDKFIRNKKTQEVVTLAVDDKNTRKPLAIFGSASRDAIIINPFAEGSAESVKGTWFRHSRNIIISGHIVKLMTVLLEAGAAANNKKKKAKEDAERDILVIKYLGNNVKNIDEKMVEEFKKVSRSLFDFLNIGYDRTLRKGSLNCTIFVESQRKSFPGIRKASWEVWKDLLCRLLKVKDLSEFDYVPEMIGAPVFESFANILVAVYKRLQEPLKIIGIDNIPIGALESHLKPEYMHEYYRKSKGLVTVQPQANPVQVTPMPMPGVNGVVVTPQVVPQAMPMPMGGVMPGMAPMPGAMPAPMMPGATMPVPGNMPMPMPNAMPSTVPGTSGMPVPVTPGTMNYTYDTGNPFARA